MKYLLFFVCTARLFAASCATSGIYPTAIAMTVGTIGSNRFAEQTIGVWCQSNINDTIASITASVTTGIGSGNLTISTSNTSTSFSPNRPYVMITVDLSSIGLSVGPYSGAITIVHTGEPNTVIPVSATVVSGLPVHAVLDNFSANRTPIAPTGDISLWKVFNASCGSGYPNPPCDLAAQNIGPMPFNAGFGQPYSTQYSGPNPPIINLYYPTYPTPFNETALRNVDAQAISISDDQLTDKIRATSAVGNFYVGWVPGRNYPQGAMQDYIQTGTWDTQFNRLQMKFTCSVGFTPNVSSASQTGTYVKWKGTFDTGSQGEHYYWGGNPSINAGRTIIYTLTATPAHIVSQQTFNYPNDSSWVDPFGVAAEPTTGTRNPAHIFDGMTSWYYSPVRYNRFTEQTCIFKDITLWKQDAEPDSYVSTTTLQYNGTAYEIGFRSIDPGAATYSPDNTTYEVRSSSSGSLKSNGFSSGTLATNTLVNGVDDGWQNYAFSNSAESANYWVGIRPHAAVWSASNTSPIIVSGVSDTLIPTGSQVTISGVGGNTAANGTWTVTASPWQALSYETSTIISVNSAPDSSHITVVTANPHGLVVGQLIQTNYGSNDFGYPLLFRVSSITNSTTFVALSIIGAVTGTPQTDPDLRVYIMPSLALNGSTGNGAYTSGGFIVATDDFSNFTEMSIMKDSAIASRSSTYSNITLPSGASFR